MAFSLAALSRQILGRGWRAVLGEFLGDVNSTVRVQV